MKKIVFFAFVALFVAGCATTEKPVITTVIQRVEIPIAVPCKAEVPTRPDFNFDKLTEQQDIFEKVKAMLADLKLHLGYEEELSAALNSCVKQ
jgi:hypothetical protein